MVGCGWWEKAENSPVERLGWRVLVVMTALCDQFSARNQEQYIKRFRRIEKGLHRGLYMPMASMACVAAAAEEEEEELLQCASQVFREWSRSMKCMELQALV